MTAGRGPHSSLGVSDHRDSDQTGPEADVGVFFKGQPGEGRCFVEVAVEGGRARANPHFGCKPTNHVS